MYKKALWFFIFAAIVSTLAVVLANYKVTNDSTDRIYSNLDSIPARNVGLLLGTSKFVRSGNINQYFQYRIDATVELYRAGKIKNIVISGDNSRKNYNEPEDMKIELIKRGVPEANIYLDFAGFRTFDSVYRINAIFSQSNFTIISQKFHNERALYIANTLDLDAVAYNAKDVSKRYGFKTQLREKLARVKVIIDQILCIKPKFLGDKIIIE